MKRRKLRLNYSSIPSMTPVVRSNPGEVFAVVGPFRAPDYQIDFQRALADLVSEWNRGRPSRRGDAPQ